MALPLTRIIQMMRQDPRFGGGQGAMTERDAAMLGATLGGKPMTGGAMSDADAMRIIESQLYNSGNAQMMDADNARIMQSMGGLLAPQQPEAANQLKSMMDYRGELMMQLDNLDLPEDHRKMLMNELNNINQFLGQ